MTGPMLSTEFDFAHFLAWTEKSQVLADRFKPDPETARIRRYDLETEEWLKVLRNPPPPRVPAIPIPILKYRAIEQAHITSKTDLIHQRQEAS